MAGRVLTAIWLAAVITPLLLVTLIMNQAVVRMKKRSWNELFKRMGGSRSDRS